MKLPYILLIGLALILGVGLAFLPEKDNQTEMDPSKLLLELEDQTRFVSTDEVAEWIINQDPTLLLIDVRDKAAYNKFSLDVAMHIPLGNILAEDNKQYFDRDELKIVFYGNDDILAEQAWMLLRREKYNNIYILKGGLNQWVETIMKPERPPDSAPQEAFDLYSFRQGAALFFSGGSVALEPVAYEEKAAPAARRRPAAAKKANSAPAPKKTVKLAQKKVEEEEEEEEGC